MRKKQIALILPILLLLTACGFTDSEPPQTSVPVDSAVQAPISETLAQPESETELQSAVPATDTQLPDYQKIYAQAVTENTNENTLFSLIYLDDDNLPELVIYDSYYLTYSIYTLKDNALFCLADSLSTVELTYFERTGILCEFARWNGGGDEGGYGRSYYLAAKDRTLTDSDTPILNYVYNAVYDEKNIYTGEGITEYFHLGEETDEASYERFAEDLGITDNDEKACSAHALSKDEMLAFLSESQD